MKEKTSKIIENTFLIIDFLMISAIVSIIGIKILVETYGPIDIHIRLEPSGYVEPNVENEVPVKMKFLPDYDSYNEDKDDTK